MTHEHDEDCPFCKQDDSVEPINGQNQFSRWLSKQIHGQNKRMNDVEQRLARLEKQIDGLRSLAFQHDIKINDIQIEPLDKEPSKPTDCFLTGPCQICGRQKEDGHNWLECGLKPVTDDKPSECEHTWIDGGWSKGSKDFCPKCTTWKEKDKPSEFNVTSMDAVVWAKEFVRCYKKFRYEIDEDTMRGWFASSIMAGFDEANRRAKQALKGQE